MTAESLEPAVWLPAIRTNTGADVFTERLACGLRRIGVQAEITWLPHRAEYVPWLVHRPSPPDGTNVIHINTWIHARFYRGFGLPVVVTCHGCVHDPALLPYKSPLQSFYHRAWAQRLESAAYRNAARVTAVSEYTAKRMRQHFGDLTVDVIPNWIPPESFLPPTREAPNNPFRLLYVGHWSRRKGVDLLPRIMRALGEEFELFYTGDPRPSEQFPANMKALGWTANPAEVREWMSLSDALIFPSRMEGMSLTVLEAMAVGLPVVCSDSASLPEQVKHGINGLICPTDDANAFVAAVRYLRDHSPLWEEMRRNAHTIAEEKFSEGRVIDSYIRVYQGAIGIQTIVGRNI